MNETFARSLLFCLFSPETVVEGGGEGPGLERSWEGEVACPFIVLLFGTMKVLKSSKDKRFGSV